MTVSFFVPGEPFALSRHRYTIVKGKIHNYDAPKNAEYKALVAMMAAKEMCGMAPMEASVAVEITVHKSVPQSWSKKRQTQALSGEIRPTGRPDIDNYIKAVFDGINQIVFKDDSQVTHVTARKMYSTTPGVSVVACETN
jgi:Holliday junction resolvase RusA-like endonuclease